MFIATTERERGRFTTSTWRDVHRHHIEERGRGKKAGSLAPLRK